MVQRPNFQKEYKLYIGGEWVAAKSGETYEVTAPATGETLTRCAQAGEADVEAAIRAGSLAFETWKKTSPKERAEILNRIADVIDQNREHFAAVETMDNGKPIRESFGADVPGASEHFRYFAGAILADEGSATMLDDETMSLILREPLGVVGQIVPWNYPFLMGAWKLAPVLAAGCCTVFKPSSYTSLSFLELARLTQDILPPGVFNVITGSGAGAGEYMLRAEGLKKLAFTGSTEVGRSVAAAAANHLIPATLELGGKSANIYFEDCNWDIAIDGMTSGILFNQGQTCSAGSRVFVQESIYDRFVEEAVRCFNHVRVGDPMDPETQMGSLIYEKHLDKVLDYVKLGVSEGARLACGGERLTEGKYAKGFFMRPTILADVTNDMRVAQEEIFGPVVVIIKFKDEADAIRMANDSVYGLAGGVWTKDINRAIRVARAVEAGRMWVNTFGTVPAGAPFGGYKQSGYGRETHKVILEHYTQMKNIIINLSGKPSGLYDI